MVRLGRLNVTLLSSVTTAQAMKLDATRIRFRFSSCIAPGSKRRSTSPSAVRTCQAESGRSSSNANPCDIAGKHCPLGLQPIRIVMLCMACGVKDPKLFRTESQLGAVFDGNHLVFCNWSSRSP